MADPVTTKGATPNPASKAVAKTTAANTAATANPVSTNPGLGVLRQQSFQADGFNNFDSIVNDLGFVYEDDQSAATNPIYNDMLKSGSTTRQMHGAYGKLGNVYQKRTELNKLAVVRSEVETFIKTLPPEQQEAIQNGRFDLPQGFIRKLNDMGYDTDTIFTAMDKKMTIPNITKLLELTYRSEYHMKQILKNLADNLAWMVKDWADSAKIDPNYRG